MYYAKSIDEELAQPPAEWLVLTRDYATQSGDTAALEPDNANGWCDREKEDLHLVVPTQSPQEVAAGAAAMLGKSRIGMKGCSCTHASRSATARRITATCPTTA